jgi:uncharacterized membrane protein
MYLPLAICESLAVLCSIYISFVEHPVTAPSYKRATVMQASLAALGTLAAVAAWLMGASVLWLVGGLLLATVIPFTLIVILPTNKRLLDPSLDKDSKLAEQLLQRWAMLHTVRNCMSLASFLAFLFTAIRR